MNTSRIPTYDRTHSDGLRNWFLAMAVQDLLFHPEDSATQIIRVSDGTPLFTNEESAEVDRILAKMFAEHGDKVIEACYPVFMRQAGFPEVLDA